MLVPVPHCDTVMQTDVKCRLTIQRMQHTNTPELSVKEAGKISKGYHRNAEPICPNHPLANWTMSGSPCLHVHWGAVATSQTMLSKDEGPEQPCKRLSFQWSACHCLRGFRSPAAGYRYRFAGSRGGNPTPRTFSQHFRARGWGWGVGEGAGDWQGLASGRPWAALPNQPFNRIGAARNLQNVRATGRGTLGTVIPRGTGLWHHAKAPLGRFQANTWRIGWLVGRLEFKCREGFSLRNFHKAASSTVSRKQQPAIPAFHSRVGGEKVVQLERVHQPQQHLRPAQPIDPRS
jgi:hypothetical protein